MQVHDRNDSGAQPPPPASRTGRKSPEALIAAAGLGRTFRTKVNDGARGWFATLARPRYETVTGLEDVTFDIPAGRVVGLLGANGAGKTTLIKILAGLLTPDAGTVRVAGEEPWRRRPAFRRSLGFLTGQRRQLTWDLPAMESFRLLRTLYALPEAAFEDQLTMLVDLMGVASLIHRPMRSLSLGQRMKLEIVGCLLHRPSIVFLDEPTIGLDQDSREDLWGFIRRYRDTAGATILITSHYVDDIEATADGVLVLDAGRLVFDGSLSTLRDRAVGEKIIRVRFAEPVRPDQLGLGTAEGLAPDRTLPAEAVRQIDIPVARHRVVEAIAAMTAAAPVVDLSVRDEDVQRTIRRLADRPGAAAAAEATGDAA